MVGQTTAHLVEKVHPLLQGRQKVCIGLDFDARCLGQTVQVRQIGWAIFHGEGFIRTEGRIDRRIQSLFGDFFVMC